MTDPFGQVRSRSRQLAVMVAVTVIGYMTGSYGHGHASADDGRTISIDCERFRQSLTMKMKALAADRCRDMLRARMEREDGLRDGDYTVSRFAFPKMNMNIN
jgi:hypothetical protein